jgi:tRNA threonylcarbamoyladenosine biosynthesis protein TsaE
MDELIFEVTTSSPEQTIEQGRQLARLLTSGDVICLRGDLGAGKTHFTKGLAGYFGVKHEHVSSPTYALVQEYKGTDVTLYHIDAYRLNSIDEALGIGLDELLEGDGIYVVEWPERISELLPSTCWNVDIVHIGDNQRHISAFRVS